LRRSKAAGSDIGRWYHWAAAIALLFESVMLDRPTNLLLIAILLVATFGVGLSLVELESRKTGHVPPEMVVHLGRAPIQWQGWQLIPPDGAQSCEMRGFDSCDDGQGGEEPAIDPAGESEPTSI
jgi:hypothetical protein